MFFFVYFFLSTSHFPHMTQPLLSPLLSLLLLTSSRWMNRLGLAAIGYTPDDKVPRPDEGERSSSAAYALLDTAGLPCLSRFFVYTRLLERERPGRR